jgi:hypothetical protein
MPWVFYFVPLVRHTTTLRTILTNPPPELNTRPSPHHSSLLCCTITTKSWFLFFFRKIVKKTFWDNENETDIIADYAGFGGGKKE